MPLACMACGGELPSDGAVFPDTEIECLICGGVQTINMVLRNRECRVRSMTENVLKGLYISAPFDDEDARMVADVRMVTETAERLVATLDRRNSAYYKFYLKKFPK